MRSFSESPMMEQSHAYKLGQLLAGFSPDVADLLLRRFQPDARQAMRQSIDDSASQYEITRRLRSFARFLDTRRGDSRDDAHPNGSKRLDFDSLLSVDDAALDAVLELSEPGEIVSVLRCGPASWQDRVLSRLNEEDATWVADQLRRSPPLSLNEMLRVQQAFVEHLGKLADHEMLELRPDGVRATGRKER